MFEKSKAQRVWRMEQELLVRNAAHEEAKLLALIIDAEMQAVTLLRQLRPEQRWRPASHFRVTLDQCADLRTRLAALQELARTEPDLPPEASEAIKAAEEFLNRPENQASHIGKFDD
jgi:hypothetical protein